MTQSEKRLEWLAQKVVLVLCILNCAAVILGLIAMLLRWILE